MRYVVEAQVGDSPFERLVDVDLFFGPTGAVVETREEAVTCVIKINEQFRLTVCVDEIDIFTVH